MALLEELPLTILSTRGSNLDIGRLYLIYIYSLFLFIRDSFLKCIIVYFIELAKGSVSTQGLHALCLSNGLKLDRFHLIDLCYIPFCLHFVPFIATLFSVGIETG